MRIILLLVLLFNPHAYALDEFSVEEAFQNSDAIPASIISDLSAGIDLELNGCKETKISDALEATKVSLSSRHDALLVKPKAWCLCGTYYCPMWLYQLHGKSAERVWSVEGTSGVDILDVKTLGYRQLRESGGTAGHSFERIWAWQGKMYKVIKEKYTTVGDGE